LNTYKTAEKARFYAVFGHFYHFGPISAFQNTAFMRNLTRISVFVLIVSMLSFGIMTTSCSKKSGCPAEDAHINMDKNGSFKKSKTRSGLTDPKRAKKKSKG